MVLPTTSRACGLPTRRLRLRCARRPRNAGRRAMSDPATAHEEGHGEAGRCGVGMKIGLTHRSVQRRPGVADDADDRPLDVVSAVGVVDVDAKPPAKRVLVGELLPHELFADDGDGHRVQRVRFGEVTSGHLRNAHRLEESRVIGPHLARGQLAGSPASDDRRARSWCRCSERNRQARGAGSVLDTGQNGDARQRLAEEAARLRRGRIAPGKLHARREHAVRAEAGIDALQLQEAAHQQTGAGEQHERQRHFGDDERVEHARAAGGRRRVAPLRAARRSRGPW